LIPAISPTSSRNGSAAQRPSDRSCRVSPNRSATCRAGRASRTSSQPVPWWRRGDVPLTSRMRKLPLRCLLNVIVREHPERGAVDIAILAGLERPQECEQPAETQGKCDRQQIDQNIHDFTPRARNALSVTSIDEPDIASAAISGVTAPAIATGTATAL